MFKLVPALMGQMSQAFPELLRAQVLITETLELEESRFKRTLDRGLKLLAEETETLEAGGELAEELEVVAVRRDAPLGQQVDELRVRVQVEAAAPRAVREAPRRLLRGHLVALSALCLYVSVSFSISF